MRFSDWEPIYGDILADFGYSRRQDEAAARLLLRAVRPHVPFDLKRRMGGRRVVVKGPTLRPSTPHSPGNGYSIAVGEAIPIMLDNKQLPDLIVTDLDGDVTRQLKAHIFGTEVVIHAHGDNAAAIKRWAPGFRRGVYASTQSKPFGPVFNFGGFTDGDRAVFLADAMGASEIVLRGFDFENPVVKPGGDVEVKKRKLAWAKRLIGMVGTPVRFADGI